MTRQIKAVRLWGGFVNNHLEFYVCNDGYSQAPRPELFPLKTDAAKRYEDVRLVELREVKPKRRGGGR